MYFKRNLKNLNTPYLFKNKFYELEKKPTISQYLHYYTIVKNKDVTSFLQLEFFQKPEHHFAKINR